MQRVCCDAASTDFFVKPTPHAARGNDGTALAVSNERQIGHATLELDTDNLHERHDRVTASRYRLVRRIDMRGCLVLFMLVARLTCSVHAQEMARESPSNIRCESDSLREALRLGLRDSPTFCALAEELARSNLIIHLETNAILPRGLDGMLRFVTTAGGFRYVRISIGPHLTSHVVVAMIGHELRHAVEIARASEVVDEASMVRLYSRIGFSCEKPVTFDTLAAIRVGTQVLRELRRPSLLISRAPGR